MEYKIPAPPQGWHFRALLRFRFFIFLIQAVAIFLVFSLIDVRIETLYGGLGGLALLLFYGAFVRGKQMQRDLRVSGILVEEACTVTTSEEGLLVQGESISKFYPWSLVKGVRVQGKAFVILRNFNGQPLPSLMICADGIPAGQIKELQTCCNERAGRPTPENAQLPPAPFAEGVEPMIFSATPEQVEEIALQCSGWRVNRKKRIAYFSTLALDGLIIWLCMTTGAPLLALFLFLLLLFLCRKQRRMPELYTRPLLAIPRKMQIADGKVCSLNEAGSWAVSPIHEPLEAVRLPHSVCIRGKKTGCYFIMADADAKLPAGMEPATPLRPGRPFPLWKAALLVLAGSAVAWGYHYQSRDYALFREAVVSLEEGKPYSDAADFLAFWNLSNSRYDESTWISANLQAEPYGYKLTYEFGTQEDDGFGVGTVYYLPTGHVFYTSRQKY